MITKSTYVKFMTCPKRYYLNYYHKELINVSEAQKNRLVLGNEVGDLAMGLFGDFKEVTTYKDGNLDLSEMVKKTTSLINEGCKNICEASFIFDDLYCAVDILHKTDEGYAIYEVKSSTNIETYYLYDVSFQKYVLEACGLKVSSVNLVTLDKTYVLKNKLELDKLFKITNVDSEIQDLVKKVPENILKIQNLINLDHEPHHLLCKNCFHPYDCEFKNYCMKDLPQPSVFDLAGSQKKLTYYHENILTFKDLKESKYFKKLSKRNQLQVNYELDDLKPKIDYDKLDQFLNSITYPLYLLDFESMQTPIPLYENTRPYEQIPFQYSLHIIDEKGNLTHKEFLAEPNKNPTLDIALALIKDIPNDKQIMAYNISFEKGRIKELALMYPDLKDELMKRYDNFIDLMLPFSKCDIYYKDFKGSYSIKYVLPALFPNDDELNYHNLNLVHNGSEAMNTYRDLAKHSPQEQLEIKECLLRYCELDTYAMVKILKKLYELQKERK